jgi:hypothetical protein
MTAPGFKWEVSVGALLQIAVMIATVAIAFTTLDARAQNNAEKIRTLEGVSSVQETRLRQLETQKARDDERMSNILALLGRIDARLERIERAEGGARP